MKVSIKTMHTLPFLQTSALLTYVKFLIPLIKDTDAGFKLYLNYPKESRCFHTKSGIRVCHYVLKNYVEWFKKFYKIICLNTALPSPVASKLCKRLNPLTTNISHHQETGQLICTAIQLTGAYMMEKIGR